ncbi:MAG: hypothetical protein ACFFD4_12480 [Candidatus Odinarchaeota archaeon]
MLNRSSASHELEATFFQIFFLFRRQFPRASRFFVSFETLVTIRVKILDPGSYRVDYPDQYFYDLLTRVPAIPQVTGVIPLSRM